MWVLAGFPAGYRAGVFDATGCRPGKDDIGGAEVRFKRDGRPRSVAMLPDRLSKGCQAAVRILAASSLVPARDVVPVDPVALFAILDPELLACQDEGHLAPPRRVGGPGKITEPKKVRNVPPSYPAAAKANHVQGAVVLEAVLSASGCVQELKVIHADHVGLAWPAMKAVAQWRYTQTLLDGVAVPVTMTITVRFRLS